MEQLFFAGKAYLKINSLLKTPLHWFMAVERSGLWAPALVTLAKQELQEFLLQWGGKRNKNSSQTNDFDFENLSSLQSFVADNENRRRSYDLWRVTGNWSHALVTSACCHEIFVAVVSNFNTVFTFFDKKSSHRSRNSHAYLFFFYRHLLGFETAFLPSKY